MFLKKWFAIIAIAVLGASTIFSFSATPSLAAVPVAPPQSQYNHAHPPIIYSQVAKPVDRGKPGKGHNSNSVVYTPTNIKNAYNFGSYASGSGQTIAIIDAYGDPTLNTDLTAFDANSMFSLPSIDLNIITPNGSPTTRNKNWAIETALDVEWAHASAPDATIDVIVAPDASLQSLLDCINYIIDPANGLNVTEISMSWGLPETSISAEMLNEYESAFKAAASDGIVLLASSGDQGAYDGTSVPTADYPASSPEVIGVGGTTLALSTSGDYGSETAWSSSGGGYSTDFPGCGVPDVAFDADPNTGVYVCYNGLWYSVGGTSVGTPNWAAIAADYASATPSPNTSLLNTSYLYGNSAGLHDVTSGNNGYYSAGPGWDPVTGLGSPDVSSLVMPSSSQSFELSVSPASQSVVQGSSADYLVTVYPTTGGFDGTVNLSVSTDLPSGASATLSTGSIDLSSAPLQDYSVLTVTVPANAPASNYTININGTNSSTSFSASATATLMVTGSSGGGTTHHGKGGKH